jgi:hypothetical protein
VTFAGTINGAPEGDDNIPFSADYMGMSEAAQGDCGYAVRYFEAVAYGELGAPRDWVNAARRNIDALENDDGAICSNWD